MPQFQVAHLNEQGQDLIIVPLDASFDSKTQSDQNGIVGELQARSAAAGLGGTVVPVWDAGGGRMAFIAPRPWHPFFQSIGLDFVAANLNRQLSW